MPVLGAEPKGHDRFVKEIRHELVMLPYYGVFDNLTYRVDGYNVTLMGQVTRPTLKSSAENVVKNIEGVEKVTNNIEVLPLSPNDDRYVWQCTWLGRHQQAALNRYALNAIPPIHIIVNSRNVASKAKSQTKATRILRVFRPKAFPGCSR